MGNHTHAYTTPKTLVKKTRQQTNKKMSTYEDIDKCSIAERNPTNIPGNINRRGANETPNATTNSKPHKHHYGWIENIQ